MPLCINSLLQCLNSNQLLAHVIRIEMDSFQQQISHRFKDCHSHQCLKTWSRLPRRDALDRCRRGASRLEHNRVSRRCPKHSALTKHRLLTRHTPCAFLYSTICINTHSSTSLALRRSTGNESLMPRSSAHSRMYRSSDDSAPVNEIETSSHA